MSKLRSQSGRITFNGFIRGFIQVMIVVVLIAILAVLAIPRFMDANVRANEAEAKAVLKQIYTLERVYRQDNGTFTSVLADIGFTTPADSRYIYSIITAGKNTFKATARPDGTDDDLITTWSINEEGYIY